jgi:uncharacterized protein (DUF934 family)
MQIIKGHAIIEDGWRTVEGEDVSAVGEGDVIIPFALWQAERETLKGRNGGLGILLQPGDAVEDIVDDLDRFQVIALAFPSFTDGRHYSTARLLRERYGYDRELRAVGDVLRDQIFYMHRCGFDAFEPSPKHRIEDILKGLNDFTVKYQPAADEPEPLFRRF